MIDPILSSSCVAKGGAYFSTTGKCYRLSSIKTDTWEKARSECKKEGGELATIANQATQSFISNNFEFSENNWLGGVRKSGVWAWTDGTPWTGFTNWHSGQPDDGDNAVLMIYTGSTWVDWAESDYSSAKILCQY